MQKVKPSFLAKWFAAMLFFFLFPPTHKCNGYGYCNDEKLFGTLWNMTYYRSINYKLLILEWVFVSALFGIIHYKNSQKVPS